MNAPFKVGDIVVRKAFRDSCGKEHAETPALTVAKVTRIESTHRSPHSIDVEGMRIRATFNDEPYDRIFAYGPGFSSYEGAARFFRFAGTREVET